MVPRTYRRLRALAAVVIISLSTASLAEEAASREDFLAVLAAAPYPLQLMAYCHGAVGRDPAVLDAGKRWNERNGALLANIEEKAVAAGITDDARLEADAAGLAAIAALVASQADKPAYCRLIARIIDNGYYDIDRRKDLAAALKRIFNVE